MNSRVSFPSGRDAVIILKLVFRYLKNAMSRFALSALAENEVAQL